MFVFMILSGGDGAVVDDDGDDLDDMGTMKSLLELFVLFLIDSPPDVNSCSLVSGEYVVVVVKS